MNTNEPTFNDEVDALRKVLENPPRLSCHYIEEAITRFRSELRLAWLEKQDALANKKESDVLATQPTKPMTNKYIRDWSKQDQALL